ncbi:MAG: phytoene/squalene synthase family protein [Gemmatimonadaceae bacterium]|nr:phytoene/squalene synthase family protein [Gemmatimonadaceae bacterium]
MVTFESLVCGNIVRRHARTFALASAFLPLTKRRGTYALYAFCRLADDAVDRAGPGDREAVRRNLAALRSQLDDAIAGGFAGPVMHETAWAIRRFGIPMAPVDELVNGVARDLDPTDYRDWPSLQAYCEGVASSVGELCTHVFGVIGGEANRERAIGFARTLGVAMQLTNILRDIGEDAGNGRCYLPDDALLSVGLTRDQVIARDVDVRSRAWREMMKHFVFSARALYREALPGIAMLAPDSQRCAQACAVGYAAILEAIEEAEYDSVSMRAHIGFRRKTRLMLSLYRHDPVALVAGATTTTRPAVA